MGLTSSTNGAQEPEKEPVTPASKSMSLPATGPSMAQAPAVGGVWSTMMGGEALEKPMRPEVW